MQLALAADWHTGVCHLRLRTLARRSGQSLPTLRLALRELTERGLVKYEPERGPGGGRGGPRLASRFELRSRRSPKVNAAAADCDLAVRYRASVYLVEPKSGSGKKWLAGHVAGEAANRAGAVAIEPSRILRLLTGAAADGLTLGGGVDALLAELLDLTAPGAELDWRIDD